MSVDLYLDEKMFISVKRASQQTGYSQDYIGQLSRRGKIPARLIGRSWFVHVDSLLAHRNFVEDKTLRNEDLFSNGVDNTQDLGGTSRDLSFLIGGSEESNIPKLVKKENKTFFPRLKMEKLLVASSLVVVAFVLVGSAHSWSNYLGSNVLSSAGSKVGMFYDHLNTLVSNARKGVSDLAQTGGSASGEAEVNSGIVVMPNSPDNQEKINLVKSNFSDEVEVYFDKDDQSGVIRPVFRSNELGEDYVFVMVPIKQETTNNRQ